MILSELDSHLFSVYLDWLIDIEVGIVITHRELSFAHEGLVLLLKLLMNLVLLLVLNTPFAKLSWDKSKPLRVLLRVMICTFGR